MSKLILRLIMNTVQTLRAWDQRILFETNNDSECRKSKLTLRSNLTKVIIWSLHGKFQRNCCIFSSHKRTLVSTVCFTVQMLMLEHTNSHWLISGELRKCSISNPGWSWSYARHGIWKWYEKNYNTVWYAREDSTSDIDV